MIPRFRVIPHGVDLAEIQKSLNVDRFDLRNKLFLSNTDKILITIGKLEEVKGYNFLIEAFAQVRSRIPNLYLLILGDGTQKENLISLAKKMNVSDSIKFLGFQKNVYDFLAIADIYILSSLSEGMPMVLLEAMATGLPVVSTNVGVGDYLLRKKGFECGYITSIQDSTDLANSIINLFKSESDLIKFRQNSRLRIEARISN